MHGQPVFAVYLGGHAEAFQTLLVDVGGNREVEIATADTEQELGRMLSDYPLAATFIDSHVVAVFRRIRREFPVAPVVGITSNKGTVEKLVELGLFDVVLDSDPGWRLLLAVRNATEFSALLEVKESLSTTIADSERMIAAAAGSVGIVHEARNLLYGVASSLALEHEKSGERPGTRFLSQAVRTINAVSTQLGQALSCKAGGQARKLRGVQIDRIACRVTDLLAASFELAGVTLERYIDMGIPAIRAWPAGIASAILELLTNSVKACGSGDCVKLRVVRDENDILVEVTDTAGRAEPVRGGKPISNRLPQIMVEKRGSGLGLALVERVAQAHGSRIEAHTRPGTGSVFRLRLPIRGSAKKRKQEVQA